MELLHSGKVRDIYADGADLILVASDRISVYDAVLPTPIPGKGTILTQLSLWWFEQLGSLVRHHVISATDVPDDVRGRAIRCRRLDIVPVECVARGYLAGNGWTSYSSTGSISGVPIPEGLSEGDRLRTPIFTPTTKTPPELGHDEPMTIEQVAGQLGVEVAERLRTLTLEVYEWASRIARKSGVLIADTKLEFGRDPNGELVLADEVLTPDSSRFWDADQWSPGGPQHAFDKQYARDWVKQTGWDGRSPAPELPPDVVAETRDRYAEIYERLTGIPWS